MNEEARISELLKPRYKGVVYKILNLITGNFYIGSTISFNKRKSAHLSDLRKGVHHCEPLQRAYTKYGQSVFVFGVIEEVEFELQKHLWAVEQSYLDSLKPEYNTSIAAGSSLGMKRSDEFKKRAAERARGRPAWNKGLTKETSEILKTQGENHSKKLKGIKRAPRSEETKRKVSAARLGMKFTEEHRRNLKTAQQKRDPKTRNISGLNIPPATKTEYDQYIKTKQK